MIESVGVLPRLWARLFGPQAVRLTERLRQTHCLSYLLVVSQSSASCCSSRAAPMPWCWPRSTPTRTRSSRPSR